MLNLPPFMLEIAEKLQISGGQPVLVGGFIRDAFLGSPSKDMDIEVYGLSDIYVLEAALSEIGTPHIVGKSFGVVRMHHMGFDMDFSLPRRENKVGKGHQGFEVEIDPTLTFREASLRRDFTVNSMGIDLVNRRFLDPHNGRRDIGGKVLRAVSDKFVEDPLRVLRAMQFAGRFGFEIAPDTLKLCFGMRKHIKELAKERLFGEFKKLLLKAERPSLGLKYFFDLGLEGVFPELAALRNTPQDPVWHPEGDVWVHTLMSVDEMAKTGVSDETHRLILMLAVLCHDFGKVSHTRYENDRWTSKGHDEAGVSIAETFLRRLTDEKLLIESVLCLVREHEKPKQLFASETDHQVSSAAIRKLATRVNIDDLLKVSRADFFGRTSLAALRREFEAGDWLELRATELEVRNTGPKPFLTGKNLLELGLKPGPKMGEILKTVYALQLDGDILSKGEALRWVRQAIASQN